MSINRNLSKLAANVTTSGEVPFTSVSSTPTTVSGYGITDAFDGAFSSLTGTPTTVSGYGITDAFDGAYSSLTGTPTTISGYGITDAIKADSSVAAQPVRFYYASTSDFPSATTWHGAIAHSHSDGAMYFAHGGSWVKMANDSDLPVVGTDAQAYDANLTSFVSAFTLPTSDGSADQVLKTDGSGNLSFVDQSSGGGSSSATTASDIGDVTFGWNVDLADATNGSTFFYSFGGATTSNGIYWSTGGDYVYVIDGNSDIVRGHPVPTPFDISSITSPSDTGNQKDLTSENSYMEDIWFSPDGLRLIALGSSGSTNHIVYSYTMTTAWDLTTATYDSKSYSVNSTAGGGARGVHLSPDGRKMFVVSNTTDKVHEYYLSTAYDVSTSSETRTLSISSQTGNPASVRFNPQGTQMFICATTNPAVIYQYKLTTPYNISTATYEKSHTNTTGGSYAQGIAFTTDGSYLHVSQGGRVYEITLSPNVSYAAPVVGSDVQPYDSNLESFTDTFTLPTSDGSANQVLQTDGSGTLSFATVSSGGGGATDFTDLSDTPSTLGTAGQILKVNSGATALEFADESSGGSFSAINVASRIISSNTTVSATESALSVGPVEIADGVTLTVASGGRHLIL